MGSLYTCNHLHLAGSKDHDELPTFANIKKLISRALNRIFQSITNRHPEPVEGQPTVEGNGPSNGGRAVTERSRSVDPDLWQLTHQALDKAVSTGTSQVVYNKPNHALTDQLRQSAALFSARKTYAQSKQLAAIAASKPGHTITWKEFLEQAKPIIADYNTKWLRTEYNTAIRAARQASLWTKYEDTKDIYPNLKYTPSRAATPREEHKPYYGIVRPLNDDFWIKHLPPSDWNCICGVEQSNEPVTPVPAGGPAASVGLDNNPGITGKLFSDTHPYAKAAPDLTKEAEALHKKFNKRTPKK